MSYLVIAAVFLGAAIVAVPLSKRLGLGSVLGYLAAGVVIGPSALGVVTNVEDVLHFAELGVVLLLFVIGLELQPSRLMTMRKAVFGLGGAQVVVTGGALAFLGAVLFGLSVTQAIVVGLALSLSSTAFALQILAERRELASAHGRAAFAILLFQDLAAIPMLAIFPLLGTAAVIDDGGSDWLGVIKALAVIAAVVVGGRYLLRYVLRIVAWSRVNEVFTAMALFTVIGVALLMDLVGLSMALGAFLAGVLLADSEYRHELEADIEPFKGLLLGLFFMAVGMSVNLALLIDNPGLIAVLVAGLMAVKALVLIGFCIALRKPLASAAKLAITLSQGGEFAFVILGVAVGAQILDATTADILVLVVTISMGVTPILFLVSEQVIGRRKLVEPAAYETPVPAEGSVIIAGFGRVGQIVARTLRARHISFTALDISAEHVDFVKKRGNKIYYGDASRLDLLRSAKADEAKIFVLAIDDVEASLKTAETVRRHFPDVTICARARNRHHAYELMDLGVEHIVRDTFYSSLEMAHLSLRSLGFPEAEARHTVETFRDYDIDRLYAHRDIHRDEAKMIRAAQDWAKELEELFEHDAARNPAAVD